MVFKNAPKLGAAFVAGLLTVTTAAADDQNLTNANLSQASYSQDFSDFKGMSYREIRPMLMEQGWKPVEAEYPEDLVLMGRSLYDEGFNEIDGSCSADGRCAFNLENEDGQRLRVITGGEENLTVTSIGFEAHAANHVVPGLPGQNR